MTKKEKGVTEISKFIRDIDEDLGDSLVTKYMCSDICPCDLAFPEEFAEEKKDYMTLFANKDRLENMGRCVMGDPDCEKTKWIIFTDGS